MALSRFADAARAFTKALEFEPWYKEAKDALEEALFYALAVKLETEDQTV